MNEILHVYVNLQELEEANAKFENALVEIASSLPLSRNILFALISLQSWKPFMRRWMKVQLMLLDAKPHSSVLDNTSKAASNILKVREEISIFWLCSCGVYLLSFYKHNVIPTFHSCRL